MTTIQITRPNEWTNRIRKYKIFVDNNLEGTISNNATLDLYVSAGKHVITAKMGWYGSQDLEIDIKDEEIKYVKVGAGNMTKWLPFISLPLIIVCFIGKGISPVIQYLFILPILIIVGFMLTLGRKKYLDLKEF